MHTRDSIIHSRVTGMLVNIITVGNLQYTIQTYAAKLPVTVSIVYSGKTYECR